MHLSDAFISPLVGGTLWVATATVASYSMKKIQGEWVEHKIPLMGVMGAFVFAAQMINFTIPGTGSSGHIGGGILLAALLGPYAGFLTMASVLLMQALFFGDGGLLAYGCNVMNLGFFTCFVAYPIYRKMVSKGYSRRRIFMAALLASILGSQLGAFSIVLQTFLSGRTELPFGTFALFMQPIHLAIGIVEGLVTGVVLHFIWKARPEILHESSDQQTTGYVTQKRVLITLFLSAVLIGGVLSWFASEHPDGLEWSLFQAGGEVAQDVPKNLHETVGKLQKDTTILPDYDFKSAEKHEDASSPVSLGTSVSGIIGGLLTLSFIVIIGVILRLVKAKRKKATRASKTIE